MKNKKQTPDAFDKALQTRIQGTRARHQVYQPVCHGGVESELKNTGRYAKNLFRTKT